jgi:hypothetical protein
LLIFYTFKFPLHIAHFKNYNSMSPQRLKCLFFLLFFSSTFIHAQTTLRQGDIALLSMYSNMGPCGLGAQTDRFSFTCFETIETGTVIDVTDNGWETQFAGYWGDGEGTLSMVRTGADIPIGTVITIEARLVGGSWTYRSISPDNQWSISDVNIPGGGFNIDDGGDQLYFMQGGTWNNQGGGGNRALYDGRIIFGASNFAPWAADGTTHGSNIHPDVMPCYYMQPSTGLTYRNLMEYGGPTDPADHFEWLELLTAPQYWNTFNTCADSWDPPNWDFNQSISVIQNMALRCPFGCLPVCPPAEKTVYLYLPEEGDYNVIYTNGVDTFEVLGAQNFDPVVLYVTDDVSYWLVSVEKVGGCKVYSHFYEQADIIAPYNNPGTHTEIWICPTNNQQFPLFWLLEGNPEQGGEWSPLLTPSPFGGLYYSAWGPGTYIYYFRHIEGCPADTNSITIHFIDSDSTTIDVGCSKNNTPNFIFDDQTVLTINAGGDHFGSSYTVAVSAGSISPGTGISGVPTDFTMQSGSALGANVTLTIQMLDAPFCIFKYPITMPGFCSDPCDYEMEASISGPEDICLKNCPDNPGIINLEVSGGTPPYKIDFELHSPGYPTWTFTGMPVVAEQEITICMDTVPAPLYNALTATLTLPAFLGESDITFTLLDVFDKYNCTALLDEPEVFMYIHKLPVAMTTTLNLCRDEALNIDLTEYDYAISPFYDVSWYDGDPLAGGEAISSPTGANLENVVDLWAKVVDDYCENSVRVPFNIFPQPHLDSVPAIHVCLGGIVVLDSTTINDASNSMATYSFHAGLPPDSTNLLDPTYYLPEASTTIYVLATTEHMCYDTMPIEIIVEDYPGLVVDSQPCDIDAGTYSILFTSSADSIHANAGVVHNNPVGQDSISGIPNDVDVSIEVLNGTGMCADTFLILAPVCNCPQISQPVPAAAAYQLCEDEPLPLISVTVDPGLQANWYTEPSGGTPFLVNSLDFQPTQATSAIYYVESVDPSTLCYSVRTAITLDIFSLAVLANLADPVICQFEPIDLDVFVPSVLNGIPGTGSWFDLITGQPLSGVQFPKDGKGWYYLFTTTDGGCESRDTVVVTANPLPVINDYSILCNDETFTYDIFFTTDADLVVADAGTLLQIPGTDSVSILSIPFGNDVQINLEYEVTGCMSTNFQQSPDCSCPPLVNNDSASACSAQGDIDLTAFQSPGAEGTWQIVSAPPGGNPATISGSTFQGASGDTGPYGLLFIRNVLLEDCIDSANFELLLAGAPDASFNVSNQTENIVTLEYAGIDYDSLLWSFGDGRTDNIPNPTVVYSAIGQYLVSLIVYNACGTDTSSVMVTVNTVSTNNPSITTAGWQIRPNPFKDILTIYGQPLVDGTTTISLLDVHGKILSTEEWFHASGHVLKEINVDHLTSGVLLVLIQDQDSRVVLKAVHQQ